MQKFSFSAVALIALLSCANVGAMPLFVVGQAIAEDTNSPLVKGTAGVYFTDEQGTSGTGRYPASGLETADLNTKGIFVVYFDAKDALLVDSVTIFGTGSLPGTDAPYRFKGTYPTVAYNDGITPLLEAVFPTDLHSLLLEVLSATLGVTIPTLLSTDFVLQGAGVIMKAKSLPEPSSLILLVACFVAALSYRFYPDQKQFSRIMVRSRISVYSPR